MACSNKFSLQKRKYRKGFFFEVVSSKNTSNKNNSQNERKGFAKNDHINGSIINNAAVTISEKVFSDTLKTEKLEYRFNNSASSTLSSNLNLSLYSNTQKPNRPALQKKDNKIQQGYPTISEIIENFISFAISLFWSFGIVLGISVFVVMIFPSSVILVFVLFLPALIICTIHLYNSGI